MCLEMISRKCLQFLSSVCLKGKISPAVLAKAGIEIANECDTNPLVFTSCLKVTKGYNLSCKYVFHLVTPSSSDDLTKRVKICLEEAQKLGIDSISFPTLGAGIT